MAHGDFGMSIKNNGRTVNSIIEEHLPISMTIEFRSIQIVVKKNVF